MHQKCQNVGRLFGHSKAWLAGAFVLPLGLQTNTQSDGFFCLVMSKVTEVLLPTQRKTLRGGRQNGCWRGRAICYCRFAIVFRWLFWGWSFWPDFYLVGLTGPILPGQSYPAGLTWPILFADLICRSLFGSIYFSPISTSPSFLD